METHTRNLKLVAFSLIGVFSLFSVFLIALFGKYLVNSKQDTEEWMRILSGIVIGTLLVVLIVFAMMK